MHQREPLTPRLYRSYVVILGALAGLGPFTIDLYLPALPEVATDFGIASADVKVTLAATAIGFACGQLVAGPLSDRIGRRAPILAATALHIGCSLAVAAAPSIELMTLARLGQGFGSAGAAVVALAVARDLFAGRPLLRMLGALALVQSLAPVVAPLIGSQLLGVMAWRGLFAVLAGYGSLILVATALLLRETRSIQARREAGGSWRAPYRRLLQDRVFVGIAISGGMQFTVLLMYLTSSPFLLQSGFGLDATAFAISFAAVAVCITVSTQVSVRLAERVGSQWMLASAQGVTIAAGLCLVIAAGLQAPAGLVIACFVLTGVGHGLSLPCVPAIGLSRVAHDAGVASSLLGFANFGLGGSIIVIIGAHAASVAQVGIVQIAAGCIGALALWGLVRPHSLPALE